MAKTISYSYKVLNLRDPTNVLDELKKTKGVVSAEFFDETLTYVLDEWTDEYDILVTALNLCDAEGAELIVGEDQPVSDYDYDAASIEAEPEDPEAEPEPDAVDEGEGEEEEEEEEAEEPIKAKKVSDDEEGDYLIAARKKLKIESIVRFIELSVSLLLVVASLFFEANANTFFTIKNIFLVVAFAIAAYEIFYTAIIDVVKKRWLSDSLIVSVACIAGAVIGRLTETAALSIIYSVIKEIQTYVNGLNDLRIDEAYYTGSLPIRLAEGGGKRINDLEEGDVISIAQYDILPCDCEVLSAATFDCHLVGGGFEDKFAVG
ncbi:MAG: hypothetical protein J6Y44_03655, partial [Clostridia bacterium]|nr:hypothetical protein [Clostridia bacterium]